MFQDKSEPTSDADHTGWLPEDLHSSELDRGLLDALFEGNPDAVLVIAGNGCIAGANSRAIAEFGYLRSQLDGQPVHLLLPMAARDRHAGHMSKYREHPTVRDLGSGMDFQARDAGGNEFPVDVMLWPFTSTDRNYMMVVCHRLDATLARSQLQIHALVESARGYAVNLLDANGRILTWNEGARRIYNMSGSQALGQDLSVLFTAEEIAAGEPRRQMELATQSFQAVRSEGWRAGTDGATLWVEVEFIATRELSGRLSGFIRVMRDLTTHKKAEEELHEAAQIKAQLHLDLEKRVAERTRQLESTVEELRAKNEEIEALVAVVSHDLSEKEVLLREVYHRVKNNLQVVQSLLKMGARTLHSGHARQAIETAVQRVYVMAMVHEHLYQMPDLASLPLSAYLRDIVEGAIASNSEQPELIQLSIDVDEIPVPLDFAIPLGLLVNELVSNCIKHGLPHGRRGKISVSARIVPGAVRFTIHDDGAGLPNDFDAKKSSSMGLKLAASLTHQLGGRLEFSSKEGCRVQADLARLCPPFEVEHATAQAGKPAPGVWTGELNQRAIAGKSLSREFTDSSYYFS
jgi:PAS domain S-box-containing protein